MFNFFKTKAKHNEKHAVVFVDYESWYYSYTTLFKMRPDPKKFRQELEAEFAIDDIMVFGDFSSGGIAEDLGTLRGLTNTIIETQNTFNHHKKDMTDFIMLDYIYQYTDSHKDVDTYIIFSGDRHFQSVVRYLIQKKGKKVVIYGVKDSVSRHLKDAATEVRELPTQSDIRRNIYRMIAHNMYFVQNKPHIIPSFIPTAEAVARYNNVPFEEVKHALQEMVDAGYLCRELRQVDFRRTVSILVADWDKLDEAGIWGSHK